MLYRMQEYMLHITPILRCLPYNYSTLINVGLPLRIEPAVFWRVERRSIRRFVELGRSAHLDILRALNFELWKFFF